MHRVHRPTKASTRECGCCIGCGGRTGMTPKSGMADVTPTGAGSPSRALAQHTKMRPISVPWLQAYVASVYLLVTGSMGTR
eukprot:4858667-Prymnesium_polylepis.1